MGSAAGRYPQLGTSGAGVRADFFVVGDDLIRYIVQYDENRAGGSTYEV